MTPSTAVAGASATGAGAAGSCPGASASAEPAAGTSRAGSSATASGEIATAIASLAMILDIELYVIGSSVVKCGDLLLAPARAAVFRHAHRSVAQRIRVEVSPLGDDGPILGCGWLCRSALQTP